MRAFVLIKIAAGSGSDVQGRIREIRKEGVEIASADQVAGDFDLIAILEAEDPKVIGETVIKEIQKIPFVLSTSTLVTIG